MVAVVKLQLENIQSGMSAEKGVMPGDAGVTQKLKDVDFTDEELAHVGLQKRVLGLLEPLG